jgi:hypothetical protein
MEQHAYFRKIGADGSVLPRDAEEWEAVLDQRTGLMWSVKVSKVTNWKRAAAAAKKVKAAGFNDYRLPTVEELFLLADRTRGDPAIDTEFFPDTPSDWFWSSTPYASPPGGYAWFVGFSFGYSLWDNHSSLGFVRAVRVGQ